MADHQEEVAASKAPYIIICNGRIQVMLTSSEHHLDKVGYASKAATDLITYYGITLGKKLDPADIKPISDLQHWLMDNLFSLTSSDVDLHVNRLFKMLDKLETIYGG